VVVSTEPVEYLATGVRPGGRATYPPWGSSLLVAETGRAPLSLSVLRSWDRRLRHRRLQDFWSALVAVNSWPQSGLAQTLSIEPRFRAYFSLRRRLYFSIRCGLFSRHFFWYKSGVMIFDF
jgi:hypothetical protein